MTWLVGGTKGSLTGRGDKSPGIDILKVNNHKQVLFASLSPKNPSKAVFFHCIITFYPTVLAISIQAAKFLESFLID